MRARLPTLSLPLLSKELLEQSARPRTYIIRTVYAALLFFCSLLIFYLSSYQNFASPLTLLGRGRDVFHNVVSLQFVSVLLFMPAITCSVITAEKERNTFGLLLLTRLSPTTILLEKLLSRLVPMGSFLLLSLPLLGFAYSMGGVGGREFATVVWILILTTVQVGTFALACSAYCRTTVQSFIATYVCGVMLYSGWGMAVRMLPPLQGLHESIVQAYVGMVNFVVDAYFPWFDRTLPFDIDPRQMNTPFFPAAILDRTINSPLWWVFPLSLPPIASILGLFLAARVFVVRRAFAPPRNLALKLFRRLDAVFHRLNDNRVTRGIVLIHESFQLPDDDPIAWRETSKKTLGMYRYLLRFLVATEGPVLIICCIVAVGDQRFTGSSSGAVSVMLFCVWIVAALLVAVKAATLIAGERSHETLDVLLSTPIRSREIIRQKFRGVRRLMFVVACPLLTIIGFQTYFRMSLFHVPLWRLDYTVGEGQNWLLYVIAAVSSVLIYLPLVAWVSFAIGLRIKSQTRAIFSALAVLVVWCAVPFIVGIMVHDARLAGRLQDSPLIYLMLFSPVSVIAFAEFSTLGDFNQHPWVAVAMNMMLYLVLLFALRAYCLRTAAHLLGRAELERHEPDLPPPVSGFPKELSRRAASKAAAR